MTSDEAGLDSGILSDMVFFTGSLWIVFSRFFFFRYHWCFRRLGRRIIIRDISLYPVGLIESPDV
jgi:hypothetical protein